MFLILFVLGFISAIIITGIHSNFERGLRYTFIKGCLFFCLFIAVITELLSAFKLIDHNAIIIVWLAVFLASAGHLRLQRQRVAVFFYDLTTRYNKEVTNLNGRNKLLIIFISTILIILFVQGIIYPPNNFDSLSYHLARLPYWISHHSLQPYPTHIIRQLYQPPFAEFVILHINMLCGNDFFSDAVQYVFLCLLMVIITDIIKRTGLNKNFQLLGAVLALCLPEVILQASSTQNDIVISFFVLAALYFMLNYLRSESVTDIFLLGLATGLAILTKGTAYIFCAPMLLLFGVFVLVKSIRKGTYAAIFYSFVFVLLLPLAINACQYARNYSYSNSFLGIDNTEAQLYSNNRITPRLFVSNSVKNLGLHIGFPGTVKVAKFGNKVVGKLHSLLHVSVNDPAVSYPPNDVIPGGTGYTSPLLANHEDMAPNGIHLLLIFTAFIILFFYGLKKRIIPVNIKIIGAIVLLQAVLFCAVLKWQPWGTRLQIVIFLSAIPLLCWVISGNRVLRLSVRFFILPLIMVYAVVIMIFNYTRPIVSGPSGLTAKTSIFSSRYQKYFALTLLRPTAYPEYSEIINTIKTSGYKNIGLLLSTYDWEYPIFYNCYHTELNPVDIDVKNISGKIPASTTHLDCIISTTINTPSIDFNGRRYYNQDTKNKVIYLYK